MIHIIPLIEFPQCGRNRTFVLMVLDAFYEKPPNLGYLLVPTGRWSDLLTARNELKGQKESNLQLACVLTISVTKNSKWCKCTVCLSNAIRISLADPVNGARKAVAASVGITIWNLGKGNCSKILFVSFTEDVTTTSESCRRNIFKYL